MRHFTIKLIITFVLSFVVFALIAVFSYTQISKSFIANQTSVQLIKTGDTIQNRIDHQIAFDYESLKTMINQYEEQGLDPVFELNQNIDKLYANGHHYESFGTFTNNTIPHVSSMYFLQQAFIMVIMITRKLTGLSVKCQEQIYQPMSQRLRFQIMRKLEE